METNDNKMLFLQVYSYLNLKKGKAKKRRNILFLLFMCVKRKENVCR